jgi:hypothetical protein
VCFNACFDYYRTAPHAQHAHSTHLQRRRPSVMPATLPRLCVFNITRSNSSEFTHHPQLSSCVQRVLLGLILADVNHIHDTEPVSSGTHAHTHVVNLKLRSGRKRAVSHAGGSQLQGSFEAGRHCAWKGGCRPNTERCTVGGYAVRSNNVRFSVFSYCDALAVNRAVTGASAAPLYVCIAVSSTRHHNRCHPARVGLCIRRGDAAMQPSDALRATQLPLYLRYFLSFCRHTLVICMCG